MFRAREITRRTVSELNQAGSPQATQSPSKRGSGGPSAWASAASQLRVDSIRTSSAAGSGHPTSSLSAADLMAVLVSDHLRYDFGDPENPANDHLIFSKGHASPLLYSIYKAVGVVSEQDLLTYRRLGSALEGHPTPVLPWVDVASGSLGQGLPTGVGVALAGKRLDRIPYRVWVLCGDSEMAEGSMWEAFEHAAHEGLDNLTAIIDVNRLGQRGETMHGWDLERFTEPARAFGWHAIAIDGHDLDAINRAYVEAAEITDRPTVIVARTLKGRGATQVEDLDGKHGKPLEDPDAAIAELGEAGEVRIEVASPTPAIPHEFPTGSLEPPAYEEGAEVATRKAYGEALAALGAERTNLVALDGEVGNSTFAEIFAATHPERFFEMYIAEQQMVAAAVGLQVRGWVPFASSFAAFMTRAYDFIRMAAVSRADLCLVGSHAGVSIGEDGPSQMGLEDLAMFRAVHGSTVLSPCDANQTVQLVARMADGEGVRYLRTLRPASPVIYPAAERFEIGGSRVVRSSEEDRVSLIGTGITVHEAIAAADALAGEGIAARVVDCYSVKPIDVAGIASAGRIGRMVIVEDHWPEGGLADAVLEALAEAGESPRITRLAVREMPGSGKGDELLAAAGIDAAAIADAARRLLGD
jgi:transketolase